MTATRHGVFPAGRGMTSRLVRYRSAPNGPRTHPLLLLLADPVGRHGRPGGQRPGTLARISQDRHGQPRHRPAPVGQRRADGVHHSPTRRPGAGIEAERPPRRPNVVQPLDGSVLSDPALPSGPRGRQLGIGGGKSLSSFPQPRRVDRSAANRRSVQHQQLGTEAFNPMPSLRAGVTELATTVRASRKRKGGDNDEEHHRDQRDRSQQDGGHRTDSTPATSLVAGPASADAQHAATARAALRRPAGRPADVRADISADRGGDGTERTGAGRPGGRRSCGWRCLPIQDQAGDPDSSGPPSLRRPPGGSCGSSREVGPRDDSSAGSAR